MNKFTRFLLFLAGVSRNVLEKCDEREIRKHSLVGAQILLTGTLALFTGGYALNKVFDDLRFTVIGAVLWSLIITLLDMWAVGSIDKTKHWFNQLVTAMPRLLIAGFLSVCIAKPMELKIFEKRITHQLLLDREHNKNEALVTSQERYGVEAKNTAITSIEGEKNEAQLRLSSDPDTPEFIQKKMACETCYREKNELYSKLSPQIERLKAERRNQLSNANINTDRVNFISAEITALNRQISNKNRDCNLMQSDLLKMRRAHQEFYSARVKSLNESLENSILQRDSVERAVSLEYQESQEVIGTAFSENNLAAELEAFANLTENNDRIGRINLFLILLFLAIETAPVLFKLFSTKGEYEDNLEFQARSAAIKRESDLLNQSLKDEFDRRLATETFEIRLEEAKIKETISLTEKIIAELSALNQKFNEVFEKVAQSSKDPELLSNQLLEILKKVIARISNIFK